MLFQLVLFFFIKKYSLNRCQLLEENNENNIGVEEDNFDDYEPDNILVNLSVEQAVDLIEKSNLGASFVIREIRNIQFPEN